MMRLMGAMEIFTAQQQEDIKDEVSFQVDQDANVKRDSETMCRLVQKIAWNRF